MSNDILSLLSKTELFAGCGEKTLKEIAEFCSFYNYPRGTLIFESGDPGNAFYIVKSGEISVTRLSEDLRDQEIARYGVGDSFGEVDMLMNTARNAEARAAEHSGLLQFPAKDKTLLDLMRKSPPAGAELLQSFLQSTAGRIRKANDLLKENSPWIQEMRTQVYGDKLTGLYNKTFLEERLPDYLKKNISHASLLMIKPDNFKKINDNYGHEAGDQALVVIGTALSRNVPENTVIIRFMGNELACFLPDTNKETALQIAKRILSLMNKLDLSSITNGSPFRLSVSIGIAVFPDHAKTAADLIVKAHELPLIGRERGGNKILLPEDK